MMMRKDKPAIRQFVAGLLLAVTGAVCAAQGDPMGYALLVQQSPADGGTVTPDVGVHRISIGQTIELAASPRPGYRFLYWLGDVTSTTSAVTSINLDSPKLVVAVFERDDFDEELVGASPIAGRGGMSGLRGNPGPIAGVRSMSSGTGMPLRRFVAVRSADSSGPDPVTPEPPEIPDYFDDPIFVPGDDKGDDNTGPVPGDETGNDYLIPEPATLALLGLGSVLLRRRRSNPAAC